MPRFKLQRPPLYPKQFDAFYGPERFGAIQASSKSGKSIAAKTWLVEEVLTRAAARKKENPKLAPGNGLWMAPTFHQARDIGFKRLVRGLDPRMMGAPPRTSPYPAITLFNGSELHFTGGENAEKGSYGSGYTALIMDEASRCKDSTWKACRSLLTQTEGRGRLVGNLVTSSWFHLHCERLEGGEVEGWAYHQLTWRDAVEAGVLAREEIEQARRDLPREEFLELYEVVPLKSGSNPFDLECLSAVRTSEETPGHRNERISWTSALHGPPVCWGWDVASRSDYTFGVGLDEHQNVCRIERMRGPWPSIRRRIVRHTEGLPAHVDATGVGGELIDELEDEGHYNFEPYVYSAEKKQKLIRRLVVRIQNGDTSYPAGVLDYEMRKFVVVVRAGKKHYEAPAGVHDDGVNGYALAVLAYGERPIEVGAEGVVY